LHEAYLGLNTCSYEQGISHQSEDKTMANKKIWLGMLVMILAFGMMVMGCSSTPASFRKGSASAGDTSILLRQGLDPEQAFREANFIINRHGFEPEMMNTEAGYIRTRWNYTWNDKGSEIDWYRVRVVVTFNPNRTQIVLSAPSEYLDGRTWITGYDSRAIETLRMDFTQSIGN
jgi:hypothetical protein